MKFDYSNWKQIVALVPIYEENGGNFTQVWMEDGSRVVMPYKVETVVKQLARIFAIDLARLRTNGKILSGRGRVIPLALHPNLWLTPLTMRREIRAENDGTAGYIVYQQVASCTIDPTDPKKSCILFKNGESLTSPQSAPSVYQNLLFTQGLGHFSGAM